MRACVRACVRVCVCVCTRIQMLNRTAGFKRHEFPTKDTEVLFFNLCFDDSCLLDSCLGRRQLSSNQGELSENVALTKTVLFIELAASSRALENTQSRITAVMEYRPRTNNGTGRNELRHI